MKSRVLIGVILILSSFALVGAGVFIIGQAIDEGNRLVAQKVITDRECLVHLRTIKNAIVEPGETTSVTVSPVKNPMEALTSTSMAVMMCPSSDLTEMCLGDRCSVGNPGIVSLVFKLTPIKE